MKLNFKYQDKIKNFDWKLIFGILGWVIALALLVGFYYPQLSVVTTEGVDGNVQNKELQEQIRVFESRLHELSSEKENVDRRVNDLILQTANLNPKTYYIKNEILYHNNELSRFEASYWALYIYNMAVKYNVDPYLISAISLVESNFKQKSVSSKGAVGVMQLTSTVERIYNVKAAVFEENIEGGTRFISDLIDQYDELKLALAHYNGGSRPYYKIQNYKETEEFVDKVLNIYESMGKRYK